MAVDVLHGYRRQITSLPHSRAELGHHQGVSPQFIKEVAVGGEMVDAQDIRQDVSEGALGAGHRAGAPVVSHRKLRRSDMTRTFGKRVFHASSAKGPGKNEPITVSSPCWSARSLTSLPTARSSMPRPKGLNTETASEPFLAGARPLRMSGKVHRMKSLCPTRCSARCTEVWARQT